jgi:chemotaxis protein MotC
VKAKAGLAAVGMVFFASAGAVWAGSETNLQFRNAIRLLEKIQDATASGDHAAVDLQSKLIIQIETDLKNAKQSDLQDQRNLRAVAIYLFSGGNPSVAEKRLASLAIAPQDRGLLDGALAYAKGDKVNAIKHLKDIDTAGLPSNLAGRVSLVMAILTSGDDIKAAMRRLNESRAFMPGTLVEEGALRRCISFAGKIAATEQLERCAASYIRRFPKSVYRREFEENLAISLMEVDYLESGGSLASLIFALDGLSPADNRKVLLYISKAAVGRGKLTLARSCAVTASEIPTASNLEMARSNLYIGASAIVQEDFKIGKEKLKAVDKSLLDQFDRALLEKALKVASQIDERPGMTEEQAVQSLSPAEREEGQSSGYVDLVARARSALAKATPVN